MEKKYILQVKVIKRILVNFKFKCKLINSGTERFPKFFSSNNIEGYP